MYFPFAFGTAVVFSLFFGKWNLVLGVNERFQHGVVGVAVRQQRELRKREGRLYIGVLGFGTGS